ncbi:MAG TPA: hypothetical protein VLD58_05125 [Gemmatimonadales bacterium]|nr:hypothetical protein [Gemmatimonadales bacterium]
MKWLISLVAGSLGGALGWWLGNLEGVMTGFFLSVIGTAVATYYAKRMIDEYLP